MADQFIACICEGNTEQAILKVLLEHNLLEFTEDDLINPSDLQLRNTKIFATRYLQNRYPDKVKIYRLLDSHNERFPLSKQHSGKAEVFNVVTAPEIEILYIRDLIYYRGWTLPKI